MTVEKISTQLGFLVLAGADLAQDYSSVYCCDLLSLAMARVPASSAWVTVIGNINSIAVASLTDVACIVIAEGMPVDQSTVDFANKKGVTLLTSPLPVYMTAKAIEALL